MKRKISAIIAIIIAILLVAVLFIPRASANQYQIETILDSEKGIDIRYPKTGNPKLDDKTHSYINTLINEHNMHGKGDTLSVDFNCFSSAFTNVIRINSAYEKPNSNSNERNIKAYGKYFACFKAFSSAPVAQQTTQVQELYAGTGTGMTIGEIMNIVVAKIIETSKPKPTEKKADSNKKLIALTFDDGPGEGTERIIKVLNKYNAKGTFCVLGSRATRYTDMLKLMHESGHEIANHTQNHKQLTKISAAEIQQEVNVVQETVHNATGVYPKFMRPPYGAKNDTVRSAVKMPLLLWNVDTLDWKTRNATSIYDVVVKEASNNSIVLFHDIYPSTADAVERIVPWLVENGYELVTVSELLEYRNVDVENGKSYFSATYIK